MVSNRDRGNRDTDGTGRPGTKILLIEPGPRDKKQGGRSHPTQPCAGGEE